MLQLALKTGWSLEYVFSLPIEIISEFRALNTWHPFTEERQAEQLGTIASLLSHQVFKKGYEPHELFPYLKSVPDWIEDPRVQTARAGKRSTHELAMIGAPQDLRAKRLEYINQLIREEIEIEEAKSPEERDRAAIRELTKLLRE
ncbi:hypothetical protein ACVD1N_06100 [Vibrio parahaemolyticus]